MHNAFAIILVSITITFGINNGDNFPGCYTPLLANLTNAMIHGHSLEEQCRIYQELVECAKIEGKGGLFPFWNSFCAHTKNDVIFKYLYPKCIQHWSTNDSLADIIPSSAQWHTHPCQEIWNRPTPAPFTFPPHQPGVYHPTPKPKPDVYHPITPKPDKKETEKDHRKPAEAPEEDCYWLDELFGLCGAVQLKCQPIYYFLIFLVNIIILFQFR